MMVVWFRFQDRLAVRRPNGRYCLPEHGAEVVSVAIFQRGFCSFRAKCRCVLTSLTRVVFMATVFGVLLVLLPFVSREDEKQSSY